MKSPSKKALFKHRKGLLLALALLTVGTWLGWSAFRSSAGEPSALLAEPWHRGTRFLDRQGHVLRETPSKSGERGRELGLDEMGPRITMATLVAEDRNFFEHAGVDGRAIVRAVAQNVSSGRVVSGASTITQQLVKLLDHQGQAHERTLGTKLEEAARAENLEESLSKQAILEAYLNRLPYGHGLSGPEAASQAYFGVAARDLSWARAAFLAVLPRAPSSLDPYRYPDRVLSRQRALLDALRDEGALTEEDHARAVAEEVEVRPLRYPFHAPHFVDALLRNRTAAPASVQTTLDGDLQRDAEELVASHAALVRDFGANNAAAIVIDNSNGDVLAWVGSVDYFDVQIAGQVDMLRAKRQPGSTLKPFVYGLSFEQGHFATEMLADVRTSFGTGSGAWAPDNFDGTFLGPVSAREALAGSLNVPAVRLAAELPEGALLDRLHALGFQSLTREASYYGLSLALGGGEVTPIELARAYATLARGGSPIALRMEQGPSEAPAAPVMDPAIAAQISEILSDPLARIRGLHGRGPFDLGYPVAVKTGTSSGFRDAWTAGYTRERTVVVWVGNTDGRATQGLAGAGAAGPLFASLMRRAMRDISVRAPLFDPALLDTVEVCPLSGELPGPACDDKVARHFAHGHAPTKNCNVHRHVTVVEGAARCAPSSTQTAVLLPSVFDRWLAEQAPGAPGQDASGHPWLAMSQSEGCGSDPSQAALTITSPRDGTVFQRSGTAEEALLVEAALSGGSANLGARGSVEIVVDGRPVARTKAPFRAEIPLEAGDHVIWARLDEGPRSARSREIRIAVR